MSGLPNLANVRNGAKADTSSSVSYRVATLSAGFGASFGIAFAPSPAT
jgi:hypothetical protein